MAISLGPEPLPGAWSHGLGFGPCPGLGQGTSQIAKGQRLMAKLEAMAQDIRYPWVRVDKPVGRELPLNPGLRDANSFYSHKNRTVTVLSSKCLPLCGKASGLGSGKLRRLFADFIFRLNSTLCILTYGPVLCILT